MMMKKLIDELNIVIRIFTLYSIIIYFLLIKFNVKNIYIIRIFKQNF